MAIIVSPGYKGNKDQWFFCDDEEPTFEAGPYDSKEEALIGAKKYVSWEDDPPPIQVKE